MRQPSRYKCPAFFQSACFRRDIPIGFPELSALLTGAGPEQEGVEQEDIYTCPICTEPADRRTVTSCGHFFCSDCLSQALKLKNLCPLCRKPLQSSDVFDAYTPEEAAAAALSGNLAEFSTKVWTLTEIFQARPEHKSRLAAKLSTVLSIGIDCNSLKNPFPWSRKAWTQEAGIS